ncbi:hypothetical protein ACTJNK_29815 [Achromobacter anxifer]
MSAPEISIPVEVVDAAINGWFSTLPDSRDQQEHFRIRMRAALAAAGYTAAPAAGDAQLLAALQQAHMALIGFMPQHRNAVIVNAIVAAREAIDAAIAAQQGKGDQ